MEQVILIFVMVAAVVVERTLYCIQCLAQSSSRIIFLVTGDNLFLHRASGYIVTRKRVKRT